MRAAIERLALVHPDAEAGVVTISVGLAAFDAGDASAHEVLKRADQALYEAKASGRNRVETTRCETPG